MDVREKIAIWVDRGKQVGDVFSFHRNDLLYWSSVAIRKWDGVIKLYVDEILESQMNAEKYEREEILEFDSVENALNYVSENTMVSLKKMMPCKGQKIFNPKFRS